LLTATTLNRGKRNRESYVDTSNIDLVIMLTRATLWPAVKLGPSRENLRGLMKRGTLILMLVLLAWTMSYAQEQPQSEPNSGQPSISPSVPRADGPQPDGEATSSLLVPTGSQNAERLGAGGKFRYYLGETYLNPSFITAPAFRASIRMANPPGHFSTTYPADWRQGPEGFGRNYGDAMAQRLSFQTARFVSGALLREDPRYAPSSSKNVFARSLHAFGYTFIDRSDSGPRMPAFSNFVGAAAAGFVANTYLPPGFANVTHAGERATLQLGLFAAGNLYREFSPQMPKPLRIFIALIGQ
jgi:hypothetical protein